MITVSGTPMALWDQLALSGVLLGVVIYIVWRLKRAFHPKQERCCCSQGACYRKPSNCRSGEAVSVVMPPVGESRRNK
ncbi:MAG: hypothetical protein HQL49_06790 [Gammaproteobacteria bacterium]|nr:hypothetical protein [Gammaproteobacteria bacterium]